MKSRSTAQNAASNSVRRRKMRRLRNSRSTAGQSKPTPCGFRQARIRSSWAVRSFELTVEESAEGLLVRTNGREFHVDIVDPRSWRRRHGAGIELEGRQQLMAPMPGKVVRVLVVAGQKVEAGQGLLVIEAMKMQNEIRSPKSGTIEKLAREGPNRQRGRNFSDCFLVARASAGGLSPRKHKPHG